MNNEQMTLRGTLVGHKGWVTKIATTPAIPEMILSASRGKLNCYVAITFDLIYVYQY